MAMFWYRSAAEQGHLKARDELGWYPDEGRVEIGGPQDLLALQKAARRNYKEAEYRLRRMYATGQGGIQGHQPARHYYREVADKGRSSARFELGWMWKLGLGEGACGRP